MLALSEPHKPELPETLAKLKLQFSPVILARTVAADLNELDIKKFDLLALYSPSDVKAILERFPAEELPAVATFGEGTLRAAVDDMCIRDRGNPQRNYFTIHVAGTNGKGSVSHMLASVLQQAGYRTGLYLSLIHI